MKSYWATLRASGIRKESAELDMGQHEGSEAGVTSQSGKTRRAGETYILDTTKTPDMPRQLGKSTAYAEWMVKVFCIPQSTTYRTNTR